MKRVSFLLASTVAVVLLIFGLTGSLYSQQGMGVKIGVVDLKEVSEGFSKWVRLAKEIEVSGTAVNEALAKMEGEISDLEEELKTYDEEGNKYAETELKIFKKRQELKRYYTRKRTELKALAEKHGGELLDNMEKAIQEYGRTNGFTLIIKKEEAPPVGREWTQLQQYVVRKSVMYYTAGIDLTGKIIEILNKKYK